MKKRLFVVLAVLALAGCGNGVGRTDTVAPSSGIVDLSGKWTGAAVVTNGGTGSANIGLTLTQNGSNRAGSTGAMTGSVSVMLTT